MSLLLQQTTLPITYRLCGTGDVTIYNPTFCVLPRMYREELTATGGISGFFYDPNADRYRLVAQMSLSVWPSWAYNYYTIDPISGLQVAANYSIGGAVGIAWTRDWSAGAYGKVYAHRIAGPNNAIVEVDTATGFPFAASLTTPVVNSVDVGGKTMSNFVINRFDKIIGFNGSSSMIRYNYETQTQLPSISLPFLTILDTAYETDELAWILQRTNDNTRLAIVKVNYKLATVEGYSILQEPTTPDLDAGIAFDTLRKTIAVFRQKTSGTDGGSLNELQLYKPIPTPTLLTEPVPVQRAVKGRTITMVAHLVGEAGEGGATKQVSISNSGSGKVLQTAVGVKSNGSVPFLYRCPTAPGTDTITVEATV